jgi:hypothetical protein
MNWYKIAQTTQIYNPEYISGWILPNNSFLDSRGFSHASCIIRNPQLFNITPRQIQKTQFNYPSMPEMIAGLAYSKESLKIIAIPKESVLFAYGTKYNLKSKLPSLKELTTQYNITKIILKECDTKGNVTSSSEYILNPLQ